MATFHPIAASPLVQVQLAPVQHPIDLGIITLKKPDGTTVERQVTVLITLPDGRDASSFVLDTAAKENALAKLKNVIEAQYAAQYGTNAPPADEGQDKITKVTERQFSYGTTHTKDRHTDAAVERAWNEFKEIIVSPAAPGRPQQVPARPPLRPQAPLPQAQGAGFPSPVRAPQPVVQLSPPLGRLRDSASPDSGNPARLRPLPRSHVGAHQVGSPSSAAATQAPYFSPGSSVATACTSRRRRPPASSRSSSLVGSDLDSIGRAARLRAERQDLAASHERG